MASAGSYGDYVSEFSGSIVEKCCYCGESQHYPLMLSCLHHCCRSCLESVSGAISLTAKSSASVTCPSCHEATEYSVAMPNGLLYSYRRLAALRAEAVCCCSECDAPDVAAEYWCVDCCAGLCLRCYSAHNKLYDLHRSAELDVARGWSLSQLTPAARCSLHKQPADVLCFTCRMPQCHLCYDSCRTASHDLRPLSHDETLKYVHTTMDAIMFSTVRLNRALSCLQQKCRDVRRNLGNCIITSHRQLVWHRQSVHNAVASAFHEAVQDVRDILTKKSVFCADVATESTMPGDTAAMAALKVQVLSVLRLSSVHIRQQGLLLNTVYESLSEAFRRQPLKQWRENGTLSIQGSVPLTSDITLQACLGATDRRRVSPRAPLLFDQASVSFRTPFGCSDLAVTEDGHVLLAAREHGLLVYSDSGQRLSSWRPARRSNGQDDAVSSVAALSCGAAAVGVFWAHLVVLLRLSHTGDTWLQDRLVAVLQSPPKYLAVCGDLMATTEYRRDEQTQQWLWSRQLKLLRLSSGQVLYSQSRDYDIYTIALTALYVVTTNRQSLRRNSGAMPSVVDAFSHSGQLLWRYEASDEEGITGVCAPDTWSSLYMIVAMRNDWRSSRVTAIGGADGRGMRDVLSSWTHRLQLPEYISLGRGQRQTVLAVLSFDERSRKFRNVTLYEAASGEVPDL